MSVTLARMRQDGTRTWCNMPCTFTNADGTEIAFHSIDITHLAWSIDNDHTFLVHGVISASQRNIPDWLKPYEGGFEISVNFNTRKSSMMPVPDPT